MLRLWRVVPAAGLLMSASPPLGAQAVPPRPPADTIKASLPGPHVPAVIGARPGARRWSRDELFATGALTIAELLERIPGVTRMAAGFIQAPAALAWHGDAGAVRLFVDGIEREEVTPRNAGVTDFAHLPLWSLEEVSVEETPGELRVHARTWRVARTTAETRADVLTGSENLNLFRGFFGKRAANGLAIQAAAQQAGTLSLPGMDGDALGSFLRVGWAGGNWSLDATQLRQGINRSAGARYTIPPAVISPNALPPYKGAASMAYLRAGWRQPENEGSWMQLVAASVAAQLTHETASTTGLSGATTAAADSADTTASQAHYALSGGVNRGAVRVSGSLRGRSMHGTLDLLPVLRGEWAAARARVAAVAERRFTGTAVWDLRGVAEPYDWLRVSGSAGVSEPLAGGGPRAGQSVDAALRWRDRWIGGGIVKLAAGNVPGLVEFDTAAGGARAPAGTAFKVSATGPIWRGWIASTDLVRWSASSAYRAQTVAHSRLWFASSFSERFPNANFHLSAALVHDYRSELYVPKGDNPIGQSARAFSVFGTQLEIRIASAVISWDYRNMAGTYFETFPGYLMPRITSVYGVRWAFWN